MGINSPVLFSISSKTVRVRSSVRLEHRTLNPRVAGSIPVGPAKILDIRFSGRLSRGFLGSHNTLLIACYLKRHKELRDVEVIVGGFMSLDGKTAPANRNGREFTQFMTPKHTKILHKIRSTVDAVIVGVDTVIADNPSLTVREVKGKNPTRIVLDSNARTPQNAKILNTQEAPTLIVVSKNAPKEKIAYLKSKNVEVIASSSEIVDLNELMGELKKQGIRKVLVEGGGKVRWSFFEKKLVDELFVWIMPTIWGGRDAPTLVEGSGFLKAEEAVQLKLKSIENVGDILVLWFSVK